MSIKLSNPTEIYLDPCGLDFSSSSLALVECAASDDDTGARPRQHAGGLLSNAAVATWARNRY